MKSLTYSLSVPKGEDIRMVYNFNLSGLNDSLWAPHFALLKFRTTLRATEEGTYMVDRDVRKTFLDFMLSKDGTPYCRVDIINFLTEEEWEGGRLVVWERWDRKMMGLADSPYHVCQAVTRAKELALVNKQDKRNPFKWNRVMNNLPGTPTYDFCRPWVYKEISDGSIASDLFVYVYNGRPIGLTEEVC